METGPRYMMRESKTKNNEINSMLSIHVSENGFSFFTHNNSKASKIIRVSFDKYITVETIHEKIYSCLKEAGVVGNSFNEVRCSLENNLATLVPKSLFEESALREYLSKDINLK